MYDNCINMWDTELHFMNALLLISQKATYTFPGLNSQDRGCHLKMEKKKGGGRRLNLKHTCDKDLKSWRFKQHSLKFMWTR